MHLEPRRQDDHFNHKDRAERSVLVPLAMGQGTFLMHREPSSSIRPMNLPEEVHLHLLSCPQERETGPQWLLAPLQPFRRLVALLAPHRGKRR